MRDQDMDAPPRCHKFLLLVCLLLLWHPMQTRASSPSASGPTLDELQSSLRSQGAPATLRRYFDCSKGGQGYELVQTGDPSALELAVTLLMSSGGCVSELLHNAIAIALQRQPATVLQYFATRKLEPSGSNCIPMMIEVPKARAEATLRLTQQALETVTATGLLGAARDACLRQVTEYRQAMADAGTFRQESQLLGTAFDRTMQLARSSHARGDAAYLVGRSQQDWRQYMDEKCRLQALLSNGSGAELGSCEMRMMKQRLAELAALQSELLKSATALPLTVK